MVVVSQGNEAEALRSWRSALDQVYYHNAYRLPMGFQARSKTEIALQDSIRQMESQCKERIELLETLKASRLEASKSASDSPYSGYTGDTSFSSSNSNIKLSGEYGDRDRVSSRGGIGEGTIPAVNYPDLGRTGPSVPARPSFSGRQLSSGLNTSQSRNASYASFAPSTIVPTLTPPALPIPAKQTSRSPSPDKSRSMLKTLRSGKDRGSKDVKKGTKSPRVSTTPRNDSAWQHLGPPRRPGEEHCPEPGVT